MRVRRAKDKRIGGNWKKIKNVDASIGIVTWKSKELLRGCLDSIVNNEWNYVYETIVVDNCSGDGSLEMVREAYPHVRVFENTRNEGVAPARNRVLREGAGRYIVLLDVDTLVLPKSLDVLVKTMDQHREVAIGGPKLIYRDGRLQLSCRPYPSPLNIVIEGTFLRDYFPNSRFVKGYTMEDWDHHELREVDWMYGAALIVRKGVLPEIGCFDESFFYLYEDVDFCFRAKKSGYSVMYIPEAVIVHFLERERKGIFHSRIADHMKSILLYLSKDYYGVLK